MSVSSAVVSATIAANAWRPALRRERGLRKTRSSPAQPASSSQAANDPWASARTTPSG